MAQLTNILWRTLFGDHAPLSVGNDRIRRYRPGLPHLLAFDDPSNPDLAAIAPHCAPGERFYCGGWQGAAPKGWVVEVDTFMDVMVWAASMPEPPAPDVVRLDEAHVARMVALAARTSPGPYPQDPMVMGEWFGILDGERLVAMAGERMHDGRFREVSGVCTAPEAQGRGHGRRLTEAVVRRQLMRGQTPFLHVASANTRARGLYERMGFRLDHATPLRVVAFLP